jgi:Flp pilus assembly protein TadD
VSEWTRRLVVLLAAFAVSATTIANDFVFDDVQNVIQNEWVHYPARLGEAFTHHMTGFSSAYAPAYYRPLLHVALALCQFVSGGLPWAFHLLNATLHGLVAALVVVVAERFSGSRDDSRLRPGPWVAGLLFAVHPIHTDTVAWVSDVTALGSSLFLLLGVLWATSGQGITPAIGSACCMLTALLFKEPAVVAPVVLAVALAVMGGFGSEQRRGSLRTLGASALAVCVYLAVRAQVLGTLVGGDRRYDVGFGQEVMTGLALLGEYAKKLALPLNLSVIHDFRLASSLADLRVWLGVAVVLAVAALAWRVRRAPAGALGLTIAVVTLLPALYVPGVGEGLFAERYFYLPMVGVALLAGYAADTAWGALSSARGRRFAAVGLLAILVVLAGLRLERNRVWRDSLSLWSDTVAHVPSSATALEYLGHAQLAAGQPAEAAESLSRALSFKPDRLMTRINLGSALLALERPSEALAQLAPVVLATPDDAIATLLFGDALARLGRFPQAIQALERSVTLAPSEARAHGLLGAAYAAVGRTSEAVEQFTVAQRLDPQNAVYASALRRFPR